MPTHFRELMKLSRKSAIVREHLDDWADGKFASLEAMLVTLSVSLAKSDLAIGLGRWDLVGDVEPMPEPPGIELKGVELE